MVLDKDVWAGTGVWDEQCCLLRAKRAAGTHKLRMLPFELAVDMVSRLILL